MEVLNENIQNFAQKTANSLINILHFASKKEKFKINPKKEKIAIALSGGADSLALAIALKKFNIVALHFNHAIREESEVEEVYLRQLMQENCIAFVSEKWQGCVLKNEADAKRARYEFLQRKCLEMKIKFLATGHHADDQIETFFINLSRGSSLDGLTGMPKIRQLENIDEDKKYDKLFLIRPLLSFSKQNCIEFLVNLSIKFCEDASNCDPKHLRNKIRLTLKEIGDYELIRRRITNCMESLQGARDLIEKTIEKSIISVSKIESKCQKNVTLLRQKLLQQNANNYVIFSLKRFIKLCQYEQYSILNSTLQKLDKKNEKIRKSFLTIFLQDIEQARKQKIKLKRNTSNVNLTADGKRGLIYFVATSL